MEWTNSTAAGSHKQHEVRLFIANSPQYLGGAVDATWHRCWSGMLVQFSANSTIADASIIPKPK